MRRAIVTGATSQVAYFLLSRLVEAGFEVVALSRRDKPLWAPGRISWTQVDISAPGAPLSRIPPASALFHLAPLPILPRLIQALAGLGVERIVAFSSTSCYAKVSSKSPVEQAMVRALALAEASLQDACEAWGISWTLFRPTLIYGCDKDNNITFIKRFIERFGFFLIAGHGGGMREPVHADDLATACVAALDRPSTFNRAYNLSGGSTLTYLEMVQRIFASLGKRPWILRVPLPLLRAGLVGLSLLPAYRFLNADMADRLNEDLCFDHRDAARDFGYSPRGFLTSI